MGKRQSVHLTDQLPVIQRHDPEERVERGTVIVHGEPDPSLIYLLVPFYQLLYVKRGDQATVPTNAKSRVDHVDVVKRNAEVEEGHS